jgi:competence ComEA-like helix-hairpin-helix protein
MSTAPPSVAAAPGPPALPAWPRSAQFVTAGLLLLATILCAYHGLASWRGGSRPTELHAGPAPTSANDPSEAARVVSMRRASAAGGFTQSIRKRADSGRFPNIEQQTPAPVPPQKPPAARSSGSGKSAKLTAPVNINRGTAAELQTLPGIGPKLAERILDTRAQQPFKSVDDLRRVPGIGVKTLERLRPHITVDGTPVKVVAANEDAAG